MGEIVFNATNYKTPYDEPYYGSLNCKVYNVPTVAQVSYYSYNKSCNGTNAKKIVPIPVLKDVIKKMVNVFTLHVAVEYNIWMGHIGLKGSTLKTTSVASKYYSSN